MLGFLEVAWERWLGAGDSLEFLAASQPLALRVRGGQFSIRLCSTLCLRTLLSQWVDDLEKQALAEHERTGTPLQS